MKTYNAGGFTPGTRIMLLDMPGDPDPVAPGTLGTVLESFSPDQICVDWDNGRSLNLIVGVDSYRVVESTSDE